MIRKSVLTATLVLAAAAAQAGDVHWSIGIQAPLHPGVTVGTVFSNAPAYQPVPVYYAQPVYQAMPVYQAVPVYRAAPVVYVPQPVYVPGRAVYGQPMWVPPGHAKRRWKHADHRGRPVSVDWGR